MSTQSQSMPTSEQMLANPVASQVIVAQALSYASTQTMSLLTQMQIALNTGGLKESAKAALTGVLGGIFQAGGAVFGAVANGFEAGYEAGAAKEKSDLYERYEGKPKLAGCKDGKKILEEGNITDIDHVIKNHNGDSVTGGTEVGVSDVNIESYRNQRKNLKDKYTVERDSIDHKLKENSLNIQGLKVLERGGEALSNSIFDGAAQLQNKGSQVLSQAGDSLDKSVQGLKAAIEALTREAGQAAAAELAFSSR